MRQNTQRRAALLDAAIDVLADEGARGLTFRAVDTRARVPPGTASNYFASRADLLTQAGAHVFVRLAPAAEDLTDLLAAPRSRDTVRRAMHELMKRISADRAGYLALLELRLEATRNPGVRSALAPAIGQNIQDNIGFHLDHGYPGGRSTVITLYLAMTGLIVEQLTLPEIWNWTDPAELIDEIIDQVVPG